MKSSNYRSPIRKKAVWGLKPITAALALAAFGLTAAATPVWAKPPHYGHHGHPGHPNHFVDNDYHLDGELTLRAKNNGNHVSSVIVELKPNAQFPREFQQYLRNGKLDIINGVVLDLPDSLLKKLASKGEILRVHDNRPIGGHNYRTSVTVGASTVRQLLGYTGAGVGIAVIDSGIANWHDDLTNTSTKLYPYGNQRVAKFVDFVNGQTLPYDDNGHGTHVSGIIAGNGYDSLGQKSGIAPSASLISLKVLDANGNGTISNIIAALNWIAANAQTYNIRVVNMSVGAMIRESYFTDPLTVAVKKVTDKGITVVAAAGNLGKNANGQEQFGGITAPGNAPWVLTVGASSTMGTPSRLDDTLGDYSSRGPTYLDFIAKPDLVAPGTGTISLAAPGSTFYTTKLQYLVSGLRPTANQPYLALTGTSMAAPVVSGTVALMLQANPSLTPNLIKAILQYTAQVYPGYKPLEQGAGFLNSLGAVQLARFFVGHHVGARFPTQGIWSKHIIWGNHMIAGGYISPKANAWATSVVWGWAKTMEDAGDNIVWGTDCGGDCDNIVWGTADDNGDNIVWGTAVDDSGDNIVWGTEFDGDNIVWGTAIDDDNIVWGTDCGGGDCDNVVWGTSDDADNIVWGTADDGDNIVWGTAGLDADNIVWGTSVDQDVTWGTAADDAPLFPDDDSSSPLPDPSLEFGDPSLTTIQ
jgi:subtilisin family serine protease